MRSVSRKRLLAEKIGRSPWLASLLIVSLFLTFSLAPTLNTAMAMNEMAATETSAAMGHGMDGMDGAMSDPCCDDCEDTDQAPCQNSMLCMSACGKLPVQTIVYVKAVWPLQTKLPVPADIGMREGRSLSPPRRPPKLV